MSRNAIGTNIPIEVVKGGTGSTTAAGALTNLGALPLAGGTMTGNLILNADPSTALQATTKQYVDAITSGFSVQPAVVAASTGALTVTYANGAAGVGATLTNAGAQAAFSIDGVSPASTNRILIKDQASSFQNGIYTVTTVGDGSTNWVLTRATDYNNTTEIKPGNLVIVNSGTVNGNSSWLETATVTTIGTDPILFSQFTANPNSFANLALSNLASVAVNVDIDPGSNNTTDLGEGTLRWRTMYLASLKTGTTSGNTLTLTARNVGGASDTTFVTLTADTTTPTCVIASGVTASTQSASDNTTKLATTAYTDNQATLAASTKASKALDNLASVAINTSLLPGVDDSINLGDGTHRMQQIFSAGLATGTTATNTLIVSARNTNTSSDTAFMTLTAGNTPTCVLASAVTGTTQSSSDNSTKLATTAYTDAQATTAASGKANKALDNLAAVAINTSLIADTDVTDNLGSQTKRWNNVYSATIQTGNGAGNTLQMGAWNTTGGGSFSPFITCTANATPTCAIGSAVTGVTQTALDNSTKLATTAYTDAAVSAAENIGADKALDNLASVAINTSLLPGSDNAIDLGNGTHRFRELFGVRVSPGSTSGNTLILSARNVGGASDTTFVTLTSDTTTPTCVIASGVTATTQSAADNSTKLATTAYADAAAAAVLPTYPIAVNKGGTGVATLTTAYGVLCAGTTATGTVQTLGALGAAGTVLTSNGAGALPSFQADPGSSGGLTFIASVTASNSATIDFANDLSATYDNYLVTIENLIMQTASVTLGVRFGTGGTPTWQATNYTGITFSYDVTVNASGTATAHCIQASGTTQMDLLNTTEIGGLNNTANRTSSATINIFNANNSSNDKNITFNVGGWGGGDFFSDGSARWQSATVVTSVRLLASSGNIVSGIFKLYGYKN